MAETLEMFAEESYQKPSCLWEDSLVRLLVWLEDEQGCQLKTQEGLSALRCLESFSKEESLICSLRMLKDSYLTTMEEVLESSSSPWMRWGMTVNGKCLTLQTLESHNTEKESFLLEILEGNPDQKYFLSEEKELKLLEKLEQESEQSLLQTDWRNDNEEEG